MDNVENAAWSTVGLPGGFLTTWH